ncbi:hypothetical protein T09_13090 [Trichinella sp. T9]|nr:hypothetical protein T09_13090 [Trichinella sp. T9]
MPCEFKLFKISEALLRNQKHKFNDKRGLQHQLLNNRNAHLFQKRELNEYMHRRIYVISTMIIYIGHKVEKVDGPLFGVHIESRRKSYFAALCYSMSFCHYTIHFIINIT